MIELMDRAVPPHEGTGDWGAVLRDAGAARRRARLRPALAFAVIAAALVVAWQAAAPSSTIDRALAAAGDGKVLHLVFEGSLPKHLVDLQTGAREQMRGTHEVWFDPAVGARERESFAGVLQWESLNTTGHGREIYSSLGNGYRDALRSGTAKVVGETDSVYWIRISPGHDVAVSRDDYRPVSLRVGDMPETQILTYETLREMPSTAARVLPPQPRSGARISLAEAERVLGRAPLWPGPGRPEVRTLGDDAVELRGRGLVISESATASDAVTTLAGVRGYVPPEGSLLLEGTIGLLRTGGLVVAIHAIDEDRILSTARSLR
jgi:hypothetical protein